MITFPLPRLYLAFILLPCLGFLLFYPSQLLIADEVAYFEQAWALIHGNTYDETDLAASGDYIPKHYPLGTALITAPFMLLFGVKGAFLMGLFCLLGSYVLILQTLKILELPLFPALGVFIYPPAIFLSRQIMSDLPSLLWATLFFYLFFSTNRQKNIHYFFLGLLAGISLLFRETNIILLFPFILALSWKIQSSRWPILIGLVVGVGCRLTISNIYYRDPFFLKEPGISFNFEAILSNLPVYFIALMVFIPLGVVGFLRYQGPAKNTVQLGILLFFGTFLFYGYNGVESSGLLKGMILGPRYFIPLLPLFCIILGHFWKNFSDKIIGFVRLTYWSFATITIFAIILGSHLYATNQAQLTDQLYLDSNAVNIADRASYAYKYICHLYGDQAFHPTAILKDTSFIQRKLDEQTPVYIHIITKNIPSQLIEVNWDGYQCEKKHYSIIDHTTISTFQVTGIKNRN